MDPSKTIIIGVDPGATTGVVVIRGLGEQGESLTDFEILEALQVSWDDRFTIGDDILERYADTSLSVYVVSESFNLYPAAAAGQAHIRSSFPSVEIIGIVSYACHLYSLSFRQQSPAVRSRVQILPQHRDQLRGMIHAKDAYCHARYLFLNLIKHPQ